MKITSVEPFHISVPYDYGGPLQKADSIPWRNMETLLVKVTTDEGVTGWGEGFGSCARAPIIFVPRRVPSGLADSSADAIRAAP